MKHCDNPGGIPSTFTPKQRRFIEEYLVDLNATQAAIRAGYNQHSAYSIGQENLKKPEIQAALEVAIQARSERTETNADRVVLELSRLALIPITAVCSWDNTGKVELKPSDQISPHAAAAIKEIYAITHINADGSTTCRLHIKMRDKLGALELLGKHLGMFAKKIKQRGERADHELRQRIERRVKAMTPEQREKITETIRQACPEEDRPPYIYPATLPQSIPKNVDPSETREKAYEGCHTEAVTQHLTIQTTKPHRLHDESCGGT